MAALTARVLPPEEWATRLVGTSLEATPLNPQFTRIIVVETEGHVVACIAAFTSVHVEGLWEDESHRGSPGVSRALLTALVAELLAGDVGEILAQTVSPEVGDLFASLGGTELPGSAWVIPVQGVSKWVA